MEAVKGLRKAEEGFRSSVKVKLARQVATLNPELGPSQIDALTEEQAQQMIEQKMMGPSSELSNCLADIQDKLRDIKYLQSEVN
jgi:t-SNARE complex subunit (syntaxin)